MSAVWSGLRQMALFFQDEAFMTWQNSKGSLPLALCRVTQD